MEPMSDPVTVDSFNPRFLVDDLAVLVFALVVLRARRWIGWPSALLVAGGRRGHVQRRDESDFVVSFSP